MKLVHLLLLLGVCLAATAGAREVSIVIVHTCDLHGNVLPTTDYQGKTNLGGFARCAAMIRQIRQSEKNVLLVDAGDTIQGTAVSYSSDGQVMVDLLNLLRFDAWCWGNHEFDWGLDKLARCAERAKIPILNANIAPASNPSEPATRILARIQPYRLIESDGVKVGIIGLNTPGIPNWSRPGLIDGLRFQDSVETLKPIVPALRAAGVQVMVLVCHQGYRDGGDDHANQVNAIARTFPELDVIIGGHTHRNVPEYKIGNVLYCQADYFGIHLGRIDLTFDTEVGRVVRSESKTILMDDRLPLDPQVLSACSDQLDRAAKTLATVIGEAKGDFSVRGAPKHETPIHDLIFESITEALRERGVAVDAVVHGILNDRASIRAGPVTIEDVWKVMPYENTIGVIHLTAAQLREVLEENAAAYDRVEFRGVGGLKWTFDPSAADSNRVLTLTRADGTALNLSNQIAVAFNSYELASGGLRWNRLRALADTPETKLVEFRLQTRQAVIDYIRKRGEIAPVTRGWWKTTVTPRQSPH